MPPACRALVDIHSGFLDITGSSDHFISGFPAHRDTDTHTPMAIMIKVSTDHFVNGLGSARVGDLHNLMLPEVTGDDTYIVD